LYFGGGIEYAGSRMEKVKQGFYKIPVDNTKKEKRSVSTFMFLFKTGMICLQITIKNIFILQDIMVNPYKIVTKSAQPCRDYYVYWL
jgi:hypothetical protein